MLTNILAPLGPNTELNYSFGTSVSGSGSEPSKQGITTVSEYALQGILKQYRAYCAVELLIPGWSGAVRGWGRDGVGDAPGIG